MEKTLSSAKRIYSIGHSNRRLEEFIQLLKRNGIEIVIDVRRFPTSKFERFKKENLRKELRKEKIAYLHLPQLGGFRGDYQAHMQSEEWKKAFEKLIKEAKRRRIAFMCSERFPWLCHRRFIARRLRELGWEVIHLIDKLKTLIERSI